MKNVLNNSNNSKALCIDEIQVERIKYSLDCILTEICNKLKNILETHVNEMNFGHLILLPTQKPNNEKVPPKNPRYYQ